ncbi:hypothetical protein LT85_3376 [Collimonas arenae]|uniref:Uncharacterized protein n=1 Tax=Collimonas arenae TaxID=279058 RepID=A0A0A1FFT2_9BURK|nr:hypothetical protein [Collimonas arenae]AIY42534.1 hypothetical protein LT85_3376 [Collimonas arenae]
MQKPAHLTVAGLFDEPYLVPVIEATGQPVDAQDTLRKAFIRLDSAL